MTLHHKDIHSINVNDIQQLVDDQVSEGRSLEYKEILPNGTDDEKREFRFDVALLLMPSEV